MKLREKLNALKELQAEYHEKANTLTPPQIAEESEKFKKLHAEISDMIIEGAKDCEDGHRPRGMFHDGTPNPFEIGDPVTRRRVRAALPEDAVEDWNADKWLPPREEGTVEATITGADGKVREQKTVKLQKARRKDEA